MPVTPVHPLDTVDDGIPVITGDVRTTQSRRTFGGKIPSRRTFGGKIPSRRTFGGKIPSRRTFGGKFI